MQIVSMNQSWDGVTGFVAHSFANCSKEIPGPCACIGSGTGQRTRSAGITTGNTDPARARKASGLGGGTGEAALPISCGRGDGRDRGGFSSPRARCSALGPDASCSISSAHRHRWGGAPRATALRGSWRSGSSRSGPALPASAGNRSDLARPHPPRAGERRSAALRARRSPPRRAGTSAGC